MSNFFPALSAATTGGCDSCFYACFYACFSHGPHRSTHAKLSRATPSGDPQSTTPDGALGDDMSRAEAGLSIALPARRSRFAERFMDWLSSRPALILAAAVLIALVLSTQLMAQPFVWENFPLDVILEAWGRLFRTRLVVTLCIALAIIAVRSVATGSMNVDALVIAAAIAVGAIVGELALLALGYENGIGGLAVFLPRVVRWCVIGLMTAAMILLYGRVAQARTSAHDASMKAAQIERQAVESRLQLLRAQIEPHFLFNTLATIRRLQRSEPEHGERMLGNFIDYLRAAIPRSREGVSTLRDELELVRAYLGLVEVRMSGRLTSSIDADQSLQDHAFPPLSLATLVENAVKHGIVPSEHGGAIAVIVKRIGNAIEASVVDSGVGLSEKGGGSGIGLANTRARLASLHGPEASLSLMHNSPSGVRAMIRIPV